MARRKDNAALGMVILGLLAFGLALAIMRYTWPLLLAGSAGCLGACLTRLRNAKRAAAEPQHYSPVRVPPSRVDDQPRQSSPLMTDQKLVGWSIGLAVTGLIGLAMSSTEKAPPSYQPTSDTNSTYGGGSTYNSNPPPTYANSPPTYANAPAPPSVQTPPTYVYTPPTHPTPVQQYEPAPVYAVPQSDGNVYYKNCAAARSAGAAPLRTSDPGYRAGLDRDGDGIACE